MALVLAPLALLQPAPTPAHTVRGNMLRVDWPGLTSIQVQRDYRYAGAHRFILRGVADAEQHAFAAVDATGAIERFYWFQFESLLPAAKGAYDYLTDTPISIAALQWHGQVRRYTAQPQPDGDQAALYKLFTAKGWRQPLPALRARLVYLPDPERRTELMIIYAEATTSAAPPTAKESAELLERGQAGLRLVR
jgi:hypothetical protein